MGMKYLEVYGDSKLIINQVKGEYEIRNEDLIPYYWATIACTEKFKWFYINHILWKDNTHANTLASLAATLSLPLKLEQKELVASRNLYLPEHALEPRDLWFPFMDFVLDRILPKVRKKKHFH